MKVAVVLLSGGLDSATNLAIAKQEGYEVAALSFDYGQRNRAELEAAQALVARNQIKKHKIVKLDLTQFGGSALTDETLAVPDHHANQHSIPLTYVPARNTIFLSIALGYAEVLDAAAIFIGANCVDYSGYPDCRPEYLAAFENMMNLATKRGVEGHPIKLIAPLLYLSKADIIAIGSALGVDYSLTVSCYQPNALGEACGRCDACTFRREGFRIAAIKEVTRYQLQTEARA